MLAGIQHMPITLAACTSMPNVDRKLGTSRMLVYIDAHDAKISSTLQYTPGGISAGFGRFLNGREASSESV